MTIEKKRMQQRYGTYQQFQDNINNLLPNEFASVISDDPNTDSGEGLYFQCGSSTPRRILTEEDKSLPVVTTVDINSDNNHIPTAKAVADALSTKAPASTTYTFDTTTKTVTFNENNPKIIYLNATVGSTDNEKGIVLTSADNTVQYFFGAFKTVRVRNRDGVNTYTPWEIALEKVDNKKNIINSTNLSSSEFYPTINAVVDYIAANYLGNGNNTVSWANLAAAVQNLINGKENTSNKLTSQTGIDSTSTDAQYPTGKAVFDFGVDILDDVAGDLVLKENLSNKKNAIAGNETSEQHYPSIKAVVDYLVANYEALSNKLSSEAGIDSSSTDTQYPTAKAVYDLGVEILGLVNDDISNVESRLVLKESASNKQSSITTANKASTTLYPSIKAVYDYGSQISSAVEDVKAYIGYTDGDILGLHADFENNQFTRLGAAVGLNAGSDFNAFPMYGQRRRVVVDSNGVIIDGYSPEDVGESDTDVDVMVYQPKFYYKVVPIKLAKQSGGLGYHIRKANYYISSTPHAGFKLHPLFYDANGNEVDYVLFSAYEASYMWRRQVGTDHYVDSIFHDGVDTDTTIETSAVLKSLPGVKPISGQYKAMTKNAMENLARRKSANWHIDNIKSVSANQLLMAIEFGQFNTQAAIGKGVVSNQSSGSNNCSSLTGSTAALGSATGMAEETIYDVAGAETTCTENGKLSVSYRGMENPWGNIWKHVNGINIWGNSNMGGGQAYIADGFTYDESSHSGNYKAVGFSVSNTGGYISAFGYGSEDYDWVLIPSEASGNSSLPVGDYAFVASNLNGSRISRLGGHWVRGDDAGVFCWLSYDGLGSRDYATGGRLLFVPTATV